MELILVTGLGILFSVIGFGLLVNSKRSTKTYSELKNSVLILYIGGFLALVFGLVVTAMNTPTDWKTWVVAVIGWLGILKGIFLVVTPSLALKSYKSLQNRKVLIFVGIIALLLGVLLLFF